MVSERTGWDRRLSVAADGRGTVGQAGVVLLHRVADRSGLTVALARIFPAGGSATWRDRAHVVICLAGAIVLGATNLLEAEQLQAQHTAVLGAPASDSTGHRVLREWNGNTRLRIARARAKARRHVWSLLHLRPGGFPWLTVAGKRLTGWIVIDMDATIILSSSKKQGATATFKKTFGFHPLAAWCANTQESLAMLLREGRAGSNTAADHLRVLSDALAQVPGSAHAKILIRLDGAGATHELLEHIEKLNTARRTVRYLVGWTVTDADEHAIATLPGQAWEAALRQDGEVQEGYAIAELTGLNTRTGWPESMRLLVRRVKPSGRHARKLTAFERGTGWKYSVVATNIRHMWGIAGSHQPQFLDVLARSHATVEDRVRVDKAMGLRNLPSKSWEANACWMLTANIGHDLDCWVRLLALHDAQDLALAEPATMRHRLYGVPARYSRHARHRWLRFDRSWPWADALVTAWRRLGALPTPT